MGRPTISAVRHLGALACLLLISGAAACRSPAVTAVESPAVTSPAHPTAAWRVAVEVTPTTTTTSPAISSPTPHPTIPLPASPLPPAEPAQPQPIDPGNANALRPLRQHAFSPWQHVLGIAWSPDSRSLAVAAGDSVYLLDLDLQELLRLEPGAAASALDFSPDGVRLAAGDRNGMLYVWQAADGRLLHDMQAHQKSISSLAYSPDGSLLATAGYDAVARVWDSGSYAELSEMIGGTFAIPAIAFTPDGSSLAIVNGNVIRLRDVQSSRFVRTIVGEQPFYSLAISPDGGYLAAGDVDNTLTIWDLLQAPGPGGETRTSLFTLIGHTGRSGRPEALVWQAAYSPDGSLLASAGGDGMLQIWIAASGESLMTLSGHNKAVTTTAFSPDGRWLASGSLDGSLILWGAGQ